MSEELKCILCEKNARGSDVQGKSASFVECNTCGNYEFERFFEKAYIYMPKEKRAMLSAYSRNRFEHEEEPPELRDPKNLEEIIAVCESKALDEKLKNLIWYIRKKSHQFGDSVSWNAEKDYPITYSLSPQEFTKIRDLAIEKGLLLWKARGVGLELTEEGWKMGIELMKSS